MYMSLWLHDLGARFVALPLRIIIGVIFINQGLLNMKSARVEEQLWIRLSDFPFIESATNVPLGLVLVIAGAMAALGVFTRIVGGLMCFVILTNLFAGLSSENLAAIVLRNPGASEFGAAMTVLQQRLLLGVCSLVLFFVGAGMFALDNIIFKGLASVFRDEQDEKKKKRKEARRGPMSPPGS